MRPPPNLSRAGSLALLALFALVAGTSLAACRRARVETAAVQRPARDTTLATVETLTVAVPLALPAQLYVEHDAVVYARSPGIVRAVHTDLGQRVRAGQVIAELEQTDQAIALAQAQANLDAARLAAERNRELAKVGGVTRADSEQGEFAYRQAELALRKARRDYDLTRIVAPFDGVVTARLARPQRLVAAGDSLFRVTAAAPLLAAIHVPETTPVDLTPGTRAEVVDARGRVLPARVIRTAAAIDPASDTREAVLELEPPAGAGRAGSAGAADAAPPAGANVTVRLGAERRRVVVAPRTAIAPDGYALVWENDRTALRAVTLGADLGGGRVEVVSGLAPGERVLRTGR